MPIYKIYADIKSLFDGVATLILDADASAATASLTVKNITGVAANNILFLREPGNESAEIIATSGASGTTVNLATSLVRGHPAGTKVYIIRANQVRFYYASTAVNANSDDSSLTPLAAAQNIDPTLTRNFYNDTTQTSGYYFYRFIDSVNSINFLYSDPIPWGQTQEQFAENNVGYVLDFVRRKLGHDWDERFSKQAAMDEINSCFRYVQGKLKRFSRYLIPDYVAGQTARGVFDFALPSDIYDTETNKSILEVRIGTADEALIPLDEKEFDELMDSTARTTVRTQPVVGATSLAIVNSYDFDDSGSVNAYTSNTADAITYTGVTRSATAGVLTGVPATGSGSIAATHAVGINVWQNEEEGQPKYFNVRNGRVRVWPLPDSTWVNKNVVMDYYQEVIKVDSESDTLDTPRYDLVKNWLLWQGKNYWRNNGKQDLEDGDFKMFQDILRSAIRTEVSGQHFKMTPKINQIQYRNTKMLNFDEN